MVPLAAAQPPAQSSAGTPAQQPPPPPPPKEEASPGGTQRVIGIVVGGAGLVGIGLGTYFGLSAMDKDKKADKACSPTLCQEQADYKNSDDARKAATASNVSFAIGGALVATGVVVFILAPTKHSQVSVTPLAAPGFAGVTVGGRL
jgi:serine/threonine-protein kinase